MRKAGLVLAVLAFLLVATGVGYVVRARADKAITAQAAAPKAEAAAKAEAPSKPEGDVDDANRKSLGVEGGATPQDGLWRGKLSNGEMTFTVSESGTKVVDIDVTLGVNDSTADGGHRLGTQSRQIPGPIDIKDGSFIKTFMNGDVLTGTFRTPTTVDGKSCLGGGNTLSAWKGQLAKGG